MSGLPLRGALTDQQLPIIKDGGILVVADKIAGIGSFADLKKEALEKGIEINELTDDYVCLPGLVDCHTHICFGGSRAKDYAYRNAGKSYLEIAKEGGGIWSTVTQTRKASEKELINGILKRAHQHLKKGGYYHRS